MLALAAAPVAACGFEPLYDPGGPAAAAEGRVLVGTIDGEAGFALRRRLVDRLGAAAAPTHRLEATLDLHQVGVAITEEDVTSRFDVIGVAAWALYPIDGAAPVASGEAEAVAGYSAPGADVTSAFAVLSARRDAEERLALILADRIAQRIAVEAAVWAS